MQSRVSTKRRVELPALMLRKLGVRPGDSVDIAVEGGRITLSQQRRHPKCEAEIIEDPITGLPMLSLGPDAPVLTSEMVRELLTDFP